MRSILISDVTLRETAKQTEAALSFKEKTEIAKLLDRLKVSVIETAPLSEAKVDEVLLKTVSALIKSSTLAVPVGLDKKGISAVWECIKDAAHPRMQVVVPLSAVQMEYVCHKKPQKAIELINELVTECRTLCEDVEFVADDATRAEKSVLCGAIQAAIEAGAGIVTICDTAGIMFPDEFAAFIRELYSGAPELKNAVLGVECAGTLGMGAASAFAAVAAGAGEIKLISCEGGLPSIEAASDVIRLRGDSMGVSCELRMTEVNRIAKQIKWMTQTKKSKLSPFDAGVREDGDVSLNKGDSISDVIKATKRLGYDLSEEDSAKVFEAFKVIAEKKDVGAKELDAIIASAALQVPPTYKLDSYLVNSGNVISATAHIKLKKNDEIKEGLCIGDGPIDAAFLAIEQIIGHHFELDDFQIQAVTEGREAMGSAIVKLRANGRMYSGKGISTDVIGASIRAYINALNKIVFEEG